MAGQKGQPAGLRPVESVDSEDLLAENVKRLVRAVAENRLAPEPDEFTPYAFTVHPHAPGPATAETYGTTLQTIG